MVDNINSCTRRNRLRITASRRRNRSPRCRICQPIVSSVENHARTRDAVDSRSSFRGVDPLQRKRVTYRPDTMCSFTYHSPVLLPSRLAFLGRGTGTGFY